MTRVSRRLGELDEAMKLSDAALRQEGQTAWIWQARGEVLLARGQRNEDFCFAKAITLVPQDWFARVVIARIYRIYKQAALALKWLRDALALHAASAFVWAQIAACQVALGLRIEGRASYLNALALDSDCPGARLELMALDSEHPTEALWRKIRGFFRGGKA
jgi:predicted Zn-dependent protease